MPQGWIPTCIGNICKTNQRTYSVAERWPFVNYLDTGNITENRVDEIQHIVIGQDTLPSRARRKVAAEDIIYSTVRPNQRHYGIIRDVLPNMLVSTGFTVITVDKEKADSDFLYYYLTQNDIVDSLHAIGEQSVSAYPSIRPSDIESIELELPPLAEQVEIGRTLRVLDDKIANNTKINNHLEQMAQAIFKSWFVDFEPFGGVMPDDWRKIQLADIVETVSGYSYKGIELVESRTALATIKNFERGGGFKLEGFKEIIPSSRVKSSQFVNLYETIVAHTDLTQKAEVVGNAEMLLSTAGYERIVLSMDLVKVIPAVSGLSMFVLGAILRSPIFKEHCLGYVNGTTVLHLSKRAIPEFTLVFPRDTAGFECLNALLEPIYMQISLNIEESTRLINLRDTLLPRLMSGELSVSKVNAK